MPSLFLAILFAINKGDQTMIEGLEQLKDAYERMPESFFDWILESPVPGLASR